MTTTSQKRTSGLHVLSGALAFVLLLASCSDQTPTGMPLNPLTPEGAAHATLLTCTVDVVHIPQMRCESAGGSDAVSADAHGFIATTLTALQSLVSAPATPSVIVGGQGINVLLANSGNSVAGNVFSTNVTVKNLLGQAMGTTDGTSVAPDGIRVFFAQPPAATGGGTVTLLGTDGTDAFTAAGQQYYQYTEKLATNATSAAKTWQFQLNGGATGFSFGVYVWAPVEHPTGWVAVTPAVDTLNLANASDLTTTLSGQQKTNLGRDTTGAAVGWLSSDPTIASVDASGVVTAHKVGTVTITGSANSRSGTSTIVVIQPVALSKSVVATDSATMTANGTSATIVTVTLRDTLNNPLAQSAGTLTLASSGGGTLNAVTDNNDGTYSATLTAPTSVGSTTITAKLNGDDITDDATVDYVGGDIDHFVVEAAGGGAISTQTSGISFGVKITAQDAHNNTATGFTGTADITSNRAGNAGLTTTAAFTAGVLTSHSITLTEAGTGATITATKTGGTATGTSNSFTVNAGSVDHFVVEAAAGGAIPTQTAGTSFNVRITAQDAANNTSTGFTGTADITSNRTGNAGLTTTVAFTAGVLSSHSITLTQAGTGATITATKTGGAVTGTSSSFTVDPAAPANIVKSGGDAQSATVNTNVATAPQVTVTDAYSNPVPGTTVTFAVASGGGSATGLTPSTNSSGVAAATSWKLGTTSGSNTMTATAGALVATFSATGTADVPASITKTSTDPQNGTVSSTVASAPTVHIADQYGNAVPNVTVIFSVAGGGGSTTSATPTTNASGNATVGSWTLGGTAPGPNQLTATASGGSNPAATFTAYVPPAILSDSSQAMGNTSLPSSLTPNVLTNDVGLNGSALTISTTGALGTVRGGTVTLASDGTFSYLPPAGSVLRDSVLYTVGDGHLSASNYIKLRFVGKVWYVDNTFGGTATGRDVSPFTSIVNAEALAGVGDTILVKTGSGTTTGGALKNNQIVRGQGHTVAFTTTLNGTPVTLLPTGTRPVIGALVLASADTLRGFNVVNGSGSGVTGTSVGAVKISEVAIVATGGPALDLATGSSVSVVVDSLKSTNSSGTGVNLSGITGTVTVNGGTSSSITNPTGSAVSINGSNPTFTFPGTISKTNGTGTGISITSTSATASFTGPSVVLSTGTSAGVFMSGASGSTSFADSLRITTSTGAGIDASNGGTLTIGGTHNSIASGTGTALRVSNVTIGAGNLTFRSISANGGTNGILLNNTGSAGGLKVTAGGGACSSSATCTGGAILNTSGAGISLTATASPSFDRMFIQNTQLSGISGTGVVSVAITNSMIDNSGLGHATPTDNSNIGFGFASSGSESNVSDSVTITGNTLTNSYQHGIDIQNFTGTINYALINNNTITSSTLITASNGSAIRLLANGNASAVTTITKAYITNNHITYFPSGAGITAQFGNPSGPSGTWGTEGDSTRAIVIRGNLISGSATTLMNTNAILATLTGNGHAYWIIDSNGTSGSPLGYTKGATIGVTARCQSCAPQADITNNYVVANNVLGSQGIAVGTVNVAGSTSDAPNLIANVSSNHVSQTSGIAIDVLSNGNSGTIKAKVASNTVSAPTQANTYGIEVRQGGTAAGGAPGICLNINGNTAAGSAVATGIGLRKQSGQSWVFGINALPAGDTATPALEAYIASINNSSGTQLVSASSGFVSCSNP